MTATLGNRVLGGDVRDVTVTRREGFLTEIGESLDVDAIVTDPLSISEIVNKHHHRFSEEKLPFAVLLPNSAEQASSILRAANEYGIAVFTRGAGTGLGQLSTITVPGILLLTDRLNHIREINPIGHYAVVEAGVINARINEATKEYGLYYPPDPASFELSTIGGNVATNAGGFKCAKYGVTRDSLLSLTVVLPDGRIIETGRPTMKNVAGFDLTSLFTGSEGLLGAVIAATVRLRPIPQGVAKVIAFARDLGQTGSVIEAVLASGVQPASLELMSVPYEQTYPDKFVESVGDAQWLIEVTTDGRAAEEDAETVLEALRPTGASLIRPTVDEAETFFILRKTGRAFPRGTAWMAGSDVAVPLDKLGEFLLVLERLANEAHAQLTIMAHAADGNTHTGFILPKKEGETELPEALRLAKEKLYDYVLANGGTITGEHGVGLELKDLLVRQIGQDNLDLQRTLKRALDPRGILNPGKWV
ncbi:FAD-binding oxidoreductase [Bifidobacterium rousetti]|uniref:FAD-binding oxidoreductase n=1 Tax=Bifidobacterium rousetti TaxID=2045439 RepID=UPI00123B683A|nr:FAD-binding oxidoreductase [Bifidobacterium rousetti]KAA8819430.1 FAD-binding oxidoreductase [Bifidobacterium rousetti]